MTENMHNASETVKELYQHSCNDAELTKFLLQKSADAGKYEAALVFAENLAKLMPDSYVPVHAKFALLVQKKDLGEAGLCLAGAKERFGDDPDYINDRLAYTIEVMGTAAAKKYLKKIGDKPSHESQQFLELCARIYNAEGDEQKYIKCLFILHKQYDSEKARFLLALKSAEHQQYEAALKWYVAVINGYSGSPEYFMSLAGRSSMLQMLGRDNWRTEMTKAAMEIDLASTVHISNLWLRTISAGLWETLGQEENAAFNHDLIAELEKYAADPGKYMRNAQKNNNGETRE